MKGNDSVNLHETPLRSAYDFEAREGQAPKCIFNNFAAAQLRLERHRLFA
jgi:hypothetical protein